MLIEDIHETFWRDDIIGSFYMETSFSVAGETPNEGQRTFYLMPSELQSKYDTPEKKKLVDPKILCLFVEYLTTSLINKVPYVKSEWISNFIETNLEKEKV